MEYIHRVGIGFFLYSRDLHLHMVRGVEKITLATPFPNET